MRLMQVLTEGPNWDNAGDVGGLPSNEPEVSTDSDTKNPQPNFGGNDAPGLPKEPKDIVTMKDMHEAFTADEWYRIAYIMMKEYMGFSDPSIIDYKAKEWLRTKGPGSHKQTVSNYSLETQQQGKIVLPVTNWADVTQWFKEFLVKHKDVTIGAGAGKPSDEVKDPTDMAAVAAQLRNALGGAVDDEAEIYKLLGQIGNKENWEELKKQFKSTAKVDLVTRINNRLDALERRNVIKILKDQGITETGIDKGTSNLLDAGSLVDGYDDDHVFTKYDTSSDKENARQYLIELFRAYRRSGPEAEKIDDFLSRTSGDATQPLPQATWRKSMKDNIEKQCKSEEGCPKSYIDLQFTSLVDLAKQRMEDIN